MLEIGFPELILIAIVGLLVIGPERLPETLRTLGLWLGRMRRSFNAVKTEIEKEIGMDEVKRQLHNEAIMEEMKRIEAEVKSTADVAQNSFNQGIQDSETIRGKQIGGGGGLVDFLRGARSSRGGRSIIALQSTAKGGSISKIAPLLKTAPVTAIRNDVDYVVTEYGVARLSNLAVEKRAEALVAIAHPDFRDELTAQWSDLMSSF